jgi:hypothetical protein
MDTLLTVREAAKFLRLNPVYFRNEYLERLNPIKLSNRSFRISKARLEQFIEEQTQHREGAD